MTTPEDLSDLPISSSNKLVLQSTKRTQRHGMDNDDDYYEEVDPAGNVVATFHVWHHMDTHPPQSSSAGWTKFDVNGVEVASGRRG